MMPPIPAIVAMPNDRHNGYHLASVVAAIPLGHGNIYAVAAIEPTSSPADPRFFAATAGRDWHGHWTAVDMRMRDGTLAGAIADMAELTCRPGFPRLTWPAPAAPSPEGPPPMTREQAEAFWDQAGPDVRERITCLALGGVGTVRAVEIIAQPGCGTD